MRHRALVTGLAAALLALGACGDDDDADAGDGGDQAAEDELCTAVDDLEQDVDTLAGLDVVADGTDAVEASLTDIRDDLAAVREAVPETAPEEADAFDSALTALGDAVEAVGDESLTVESAQGVVTAVATTVETGEDYVAALDDACP